MQELKVMREELKSRDSYIGKCVLDNTKLRRETKQLTLKLQFEIKNNQMLSKNLNRMRLSYI